MYQANPLHVHKQVGGHNFKAFIPVQKGIKKVQSLPKFSEVTEYWDYIYSSKTTVKQTAVYFLFKVANKTLHSN